MKREEIETWAKDVESLLASERIRCTDRVMVVRETSSTQDVARQMCGGKPGLMVIAGRQTSGRGRLGRGWADTSQFGLALTFTIDCTQNQTGRLAIVAGLAACAAAAGMLAGAAATLGLRWPNDVVERTPDQRGRKVGGVLIEQARGLAFVGIGINISQRETDWPDELRHRAVSLGQLGSVVGRLEVALRLIPEFDRALASPDDELERQWMERETLMGARRTFEHNSTRYTGSIAAISPSLGVHLRMDDGQLQHLPALTTSLIHD
ncbi:MAG: hypothetical protein IT435_09075 [Phycisphaerales bacterium]|nr:hypothetical protein [Phycisphaerales bacterium]